MVSNKKPYFEPVDQKVDFSLLEERLFNKWYQEGIPDKYLHKNKNSTKYFSFLDGPITANNPMGVHHAWGRTYKDLFQRYKNMQGFRQRFQNGFDCQGLWVEVEVEKELGIKSKKDIENLIPGNKEASIEKFVGLCKERVKKYSEVQAGQSKRLGYLMDWENSYYTLSDNNNYMIWRFIKACHDNGWIYKGNDVVPWCYRCETAISQHEILTEDYKDVTHKSVFLEFKIKDREKEFLLVWTTTPWTVPANIAVAVDKNKDYSLVVGSDGNKFWVASALVENVFKGNQKEVEKKVPGRELVGLKYLSPFDDLPVVSEALEKYLNMHTVIATDDLLMPISETEGTGLVHTSTGTGEEDHRLGKKIGLPIISAIDDEANYLDGYGSLSGKNAKKDPDLILNILKDKEERKEDCLFEILSYKHRYPVCWRCKTELVWKLTDEWYVAMDRPSRKATAGKYTLRERMIKITRRIEWLPEFGLERELDWLKNMHDWLISKKNRYWGLALPIWECRKCGDFDVIGSHEELKERAVRGWSEFDGKSPHKPQIDGVKIECRRCGGEADRIEPVGNPWLDAGIVSFSTISDNNKDPLYLNNRVKWQKWFPADFITESFPGQFKNWFYSLIAMSAVLENSEPFKKVLGYATVLDENGKVMHKSSGNMIGFDEGLEKIGIDVMRWMFVRQNPAEDLLFGYKLADETRRRFHLKLWNIYNFFVTYANLDGFKPPEITNYKLQITNLPILDRWVLVRLNKTVRDVTGYLDKYDAYTASGEIEKFIDDLSNWYVRRSRDRVGPAAESDEDRGMFYLTLYRVLIDVSIILSPFNPFISDEIYCSLTKKESVCLADWPSFAPSTSLRASEGKPDLSILVQMEEVRRLVERVHAKRKEENIPVRQPLASVKVIGSRKGDFDIDILKLAKEELNVKEIVFEKGKEEIVLDTTPTPELEEEAGTRELIRKIQEERKKMGLNLTQLACVEAEWLPSSPELVSRLKRKTLSSSVRLGSEFKVFLDK